MADDFELNFAAQGPSFDDVLASTAKPKSKSAPKKQRAEAYTGTGKKSAPKFRAKKSDSIDGPGRVADDGFEEVAGDKPEKPEASEADEPRKRFVHEERALPTVKRPEAKELSKEAVLKSKAAGDGAVFGTEVRKFADLGLDAKLVKILEEKMGMEKPTFIQSHAIPYLLTGRDVMIKSETGSGKTLAYLLPVVHQLMSAVPKIERSAGTKAIILAPARELCLQIWTVLQKLLTACVWIVGGTVMGGEKKKGEKARLRKGIGILVCTPGRLLDHLFNSTAFNTSTLRWLVLDEADRLLDMGFDEDITKIVTFLNQKSSAKSDKNRRQNVLVSATLEDRVSKLASLALKNPVYAGFDKLGVKTPAPKIKVVKKDKPKKEPRYKFGTEELETDTESENEVEAAEEEEEAPRDREVDANEDNASETGGFKIKKASVLAAEGADVTTGGSSAAGEAYRLPKNLLQQYVTVDPRQRLVVLGALLRARITDAKAKGLSLKAIVFASTCAEVDFYHKLYSHAYWPDRHQDGTAIPEEDHTALLDVPLLKLHGNMAQGDRTKTYFSFQKMEGGILFCTDVAARGLDLPAVDYIVQYDPPELTEDYIHRVGRTARMGRKGQAILFLMESELGYLDVLKEQGISIEYLKVEGVLRALRFSTFVKDDGGPPGLRLQKQFDSMVSHNQELQSEAATAYSAYLRSYAAYPKAMKPIFHTRKLHLGHIAKAFALTQAPTALKHNTTITTSKKHQTKEYEHKTWRKKRKGGADEAEADEPAALPPGIEEFLDDKEDDAPAPRTPASGPAVQRLPIRPGRKGKKPQLGTRVGAGSLRHIADGKNEINGKRKQPGNSSGSSRKSGGNKKPKYDPAAEFASS